MTEFDVGLILAAWLTGLAGGSGDCIGMCGGILGALGASVVVGLFGSSGVVILRGIAAVLIFLIGLQLLFGMPLLRKLEQGGAGFWRLLAPQMQRLLPPARW